MDISERLNEVLAVSEEVEDVLMDEVLEEAEPIEDDLDEDDLDMVDLGDLHDEGIPVVDYDDYVSMMDEGHRDDWEDLDEDEDGPVKLEEVDLADLAENEIPIVWMDEDGEVDEGIVGDVFKAMTPNLQRKLRKKRRQAPQPVPMKRGNPMLRKMQRVAPTHQVADIDLENPLFDEGAYSALLNLKSKSKGKLAGILRKIGIKRKAARGMVQRQQGWGAKKQTSGWGAKGKQPGLPSARRPVAGPALGGSKSKGSSPAPKLGVKRRGGSWAKEDADAALASRLDEFFGGVATATMAKYAGSREGARADSRSAERLMKRSTKDKAFRRRLDKMSGNKERGLKGMKARKQFLQRNVTNWPARVFKNER